MTASSRRRLLPTLLLLLTSSMIGAVACGRSPIPLPEQDIQLVCTDPPAFYRYDPAKDMWSEESSFERVFPLLNMVPTEHGAIIHGKPVVIARTPSETILWHDGEAFSVFEARLDPAPVLPFGWIDPRKGTLAFHLANTGVPGTFSLLDLDSCESSGCEARPLVGLPVWSPDSSQMILMQNTILFPDPIANTESSLSRGDAEGLSLTPIGPGFSPFWLDNQTYGYVRQDLSDPDMREIVIASIANDEAQVLLTLQDLLRTVPAERRPAKPSISHVAVNPSNTDLLLVLVSDLSADPASYVFLYQRSEDSTQPGDISLRQVDDAAIGPFFSPDGRWLMASSLDSETRAWELYVHDIEQNRTTTFTSDFSAFEPQEPPFQLTGWDWSSDGEWLAKIDDGAIDLIAPAHDYAREIEHELPSQNCPIVAWISKPED